MSAPGAASVFGILCGGGTSLAPDVEVVEGVIEARAAFERLVSVFDLAALDPTEGSASMRIARPMFTTWKGALEPADRSYRDLQLVIGESGTGVAVADDDAILAGTTITENENVVTSGFADPDVYRVLTVTGDVSVLQGHGVIILGTNWGGEAIAEEIEIGTPGISVAGKKPFLGVTSIVLPGVPSAGGAQVKVGTSNKLGLHEPVPDVASVIDNGRRTCSGSDAAFDYVAVDQNGVDPVYATVDVTARFNDGSFASGDCLVLSYLAPR
jgi:hypothetical protein